MFSYQEFVFNCIRPQLHFKPDHSNYTHPMSICCMKRLLSSRIKHAKGRYALSTKEMDEPESTISFTLLASSFPSMMGTCSLEMPAVINSWASRHERNDLWPLKWSFQVHCPGADNLLLHVQVDCSCGPQTRFT